MTRVVMVGVDGSADSIAAMHWAIQRAAELCALVRVVHVAPSRDGSPRKPRRAQERSWTHPAVPAEEVVSGAPSRADGGSVVVEHQVVEGKPGQVLTELTQDAEHLVDLLVVGAVGRDRASFASPPSPGSTARRVMRRATCPVAIIRHSHVFDEPRRPTTEVGRARRSSTSARPAPEVLEPAAR